MNLTKFIPWTYKPPLRTRTKKEREKKWQHDTHGSSKIRVWLCDSYNPPPKPPSRMDKHREQAKENRRQWLKKLGRRVTI